jgi:hypothetical protein
LIDAIAGLSLAMAYVRSYYRLSRRGKEEASVFGLKGSFLYVPFEEAPASEDLSWHFCLAIFCAPANWIDKPFFGGKSPPQRAIWRLSE